MKSRTLYLIILILIMVGLLLSACSPNPSSATEPAADVTAPSSGAGASSGDIAETDVAVVEASSATAEAVAGNASPPSADQAREAALTLLQGDKLEVRHEAGGDFTSVSGTEMVGDGHTIRTGDNSVALLIFYDNTEMVLFPNSELAIRSFAEEADGSFLIQLEQLLGKLFHRANFTNRQAGSEYILTTPNGVAAIRGTAYWSVVDTDANIDTFLCIVGKVEITPTAASGGQVRVVECEGKTVTIDENGNVTTNPLDPSLFQGDGICDPYMGEDAVSDPQDCAPSSTNILYCGNGICEPTVGEDSTVCPIDCGP